MTIWNKGKRLSDAHKEKISVTLKNRIFTLEHKKKISESVKGIKNGMYGKQHAEKSRKKMSLSRKGKKLTEEHKRKIGEAQLKEKHHMWGKKHSQETKIKISKTQKGIPKLKLRGKRMSEETKQKISIALTGKRKREKSNLWKGGISSARQQIYNSQEYKNWRTQVFQRDKYQCQMPGCPKITRELNANHIKLFSEYPNLRFEITNGITLCADCHRFIRNRETRYEQLLNLIVYHNSSHL